VNDKAVLSAEAVQFGYPRCPNFLGPLDVQIRSASMLAVLGPNGAGKSTMLRILCGLLRPTAGVVYLQGEPLSKTPARRRASAIAFLPQAPLLPPDLVVYDVVLRGRYPHRHFGVFEASADHQIVEKSLRITDTTQFADRTLDTLSAGERQRVFLAAALAQEPSVLVLDEPTSALDPFHQLRVLELLRELSRTHEMAVIVATHDLNLAGQHCDSLLLLSAGCIAAAGVADEVLIPEVLGPVYGVSFHSIADPAKSWRWVFPVKGSVR